MTYDKGPREHTKILRRASELLHGLYCRYLWVDFDPEALVLLENIRAKLDELIRSGREKLGLSKQGSFEELQQALQNDSQSVIEALRVALIEDYNHLEFCGVGGMGIVLVGKHKTLGRQAALKFNLHIALLYNLTNDLQPSIYVDI